MVRHDTRDCRYDSYRNINNDLAYTPYGMVLDSEVCTEISEELKMTSIQCVYDSEQKRVLRGLYSPY